MFEPVLVIDVPIATSFPDPNKMSTQTIPPESFQTKRIVGRKPKLTDAKAMFKTYATDPEVSRYLIFKPYEKLEDLETWLTFIIKEWETKPGIMYLFFNKEYPNQLIGSFGLEIDRFKVEVGYLVARPYWGQGIITDVLKFGSPGLWLNRRSTG